MVMKIKELREGGGGRRGGRGGRRRYQFCFFEVINIFKTSRQPKNKIQSRYIMLEK